MSFKGGKLSFEPISRTKETYDERNPCCEKETREVENHVFGRNCEMSVG